MKDIIKSLSILLILASCTTKKPVVQSDYAKAMQNLKIGNYKMAAETFEKIEDTQPFTKEATNGLIMSSYAYYKSKDYDDSVRVINYFIQSNPMNENLAYMQYLKGLNYFDRMTSMNKARDIIENADIAFREVIYKYPDTEYAKDAMARLKVTETYLSGNEMNVAKYYLNRKNYIGAINHYTKVIKDYPQSNFVPEALYRLVEISSVLKLRTEAIQYHKILLKNYKNSIWRKHSTKLIKQYGKA